MAEPIRRSGRPTKHTTKTLDLMDQSEPTKKKSGNKKAKKVVEEVEEAAEEVIRCVCGAVESPEDDPEPWIACDNCLVWQHNVCVGLPTFQEDIPEDYLCEECSPESHKELLDGLERGVKVWEVRRREYERGLVEEEEAPKKKGKKKGGKRTSDPKVDSGNGTNGKTGSPFTPVADGKKKDTKVASTKRKARDESHDQEPPKEPQAKARKVSAQHTPHSSQTPQTPQPQQSTKPRSTSPSSSLPTEITKLDSERIPGAKVIENGLKYAIPISIKNGVFKLRSDDTVEKKAERLAIQINDVVFNTCPDKASSQKQAKSLGSNLKINQELCDGLLGGSLSVSSFAVMNSDDMQSKKMKRETAEMQARADKQSIMINDDGPRIRRTHKGEEVIEDDGFAVTSDTTMPTSRRRSMLDPNADMATRSRENSPGNEVELPDNIDYSKSHDDIRGQATAKQPLNVETKQPPLRKSSTQADFDINKVFSSVQSPVVPQHTRQQSNNTALPSNGPGVDHEIDRMLEEEPGAESPPYSPAEHDADPSIIWGGGVVMDSIAKFPAHARYIAGVDVSTVRWTDILPRELKVAGRIDQEKANEYLCSLRYSPPTDVAVVNIIPEGEVASQSFQALYSYFVGKNRYGVLANKGIGNVRDTYLIPVQPSPAPLPDFITNLEGHIVPEHRPEPLVFVALVIKNENDQQLEAASPSVPSHQRVMSMSGTGPSMSPIAQQQPTFGAVQRPQGSINQQYPVDAQRRNQDIAQSKGEALAREILGPYFHAPTVTFLMPNAYQMRQIEWEVMRRILEEDERARSDLVHLGQVLDIRMAQQPPQQPQA